MNIFKLIHWAGKSNIGWVLLCLGIIGFVLLMRWYKSIAALKKLATARWRSLLIKNGSMFQKSVKIILLFVATIFIGFALLRPQWDKKEEKIEEAGRDLLIAVDISRSMLGTDLKPNRLEFAKQKIKKILFNLSCERVGLILFSGDTVIQCPLTKDYATFLMFLDDLGVETISSGTTTLDGAIKAALKVFADMPEKKTKILCMFTDGEDFSSNLSVLKEQAAKEHLTIFSFGVGTTHGAPIPILDYQGKQVGFEKDSAGKIIMSKLNEGILKNLSEQTGGHYISVTPNDDRDVSTFIKQVEKFEKDSFQDSQINRYQEQYPYFIAVSLICLLVEWLL